MKTKDELELEKQRVAFVASDLVQDGMCIGLGSGTTMAYAIKRLGERIRRDGIKVVAVPTSFISRQLATEAGIALVEPSRGLRLDLTIDGADEIGPNLSLIKGGGGALFREKLIAFASRQVVIIGDSSKPVSVLGKFPLPIEVIPFAVPWVMDRISDLGGDPILRYNKDRPGELVVTDQGNWLLDCHFIEIPNPSVLAARLAEITGVLEYGLFIGLANVAIVADGETVSTIRHDRQTGK